MISHHLAFAFGTALQAMGRGPFGFGRGERGQDFMGEGGIPAGRKLSSADLQLVILAFLEKQQAHGYEFIRAIEARSNGFYIPSPGVIYPALTYIEEIGQAAVEPDGNRKLYRITGEGRQYLEANRAKVEATSTPWAGLAVGWNKSAKLLPDWTRPIPWPQTNFTGCATLLNTR